MKNIKPAVVKTYLTKICLGAIVVALAGCGHSFIPPTDSEVKSSVEFSCTNSPEMLQLIANTPPDPMTQEQQKAATAALSNNDPSAMLSQGVKAIDVKPGTPRISGATEVAIGIPDGTDLFPTRVTISAYGMNRTIDFYFYKNDHNEWNLIPEKQ
jgi:hypothetical protein